LHTLGAQHLHINEGLLAGGRRDLARGIATPSRGKRNRTITFWENVTSSIFAHQIKKITTEK
jgi:hypothetical protein